MRASYVVTWHTRSDERSYVYVYCLKATHGGAAWTSAHGGTECVLGDIWLDCGRLRVETGALTLSSIIRGTISWRVSFQSRGPRRTVCGGIRGTMLNGGLDGRAIVTVAAPSVTTGPSAISSEHLPPVEEY